MARTREIPAPASAPARVRRGYFECRYGQLHVHHAMPPGGGFEEATPLLCVHDCPGSGRAFAAFLALAGRDRSGYAPDLPGFGESDAPPTPVTVTEYAQALGDFIDTMRLRRLDVIAVRAGAALALELALAYPAQVGRVVVAAAPQRAPAEPNLPEWEQKLLGALAVPPPRERLARLQAKLLVLRPQDEPAEATTRLREALPAARPQELPLASREVPAGDPGRLFEAVRDFLRG